MLNGLWTMLAHGRPEHLHALSRDPAMARAHVAAGAGIARYTHSRGNTALDIHALSRRHPQLALASVDWPRSSGEARLYRGGAGHAVPLCDAPIAGTSALLGTSGRTAAITIDGRPTQVGAWADALRARSAAGVATLLRERYIAGGQSDPLLVLAAPGPNGRTGDIKATFAETPDITCRRGCGGEADGGPKAGGPDLWHVELSQAGIVATCERALAHAGSARWVQLPELENLLGVGVDTVATDVLLRATFAAASGLVPDAATGSALTELGRSFSSLAVGGHRDSLTLALFHTVYDNIETTPGPQIVHAVHGALSPNT